MGVLMGLFLKESCWNIAKDLPEVPPKLPLACPHLQNQANGVSQLY